MRLKLAIGLGVLLCTHPALAVQGGSEDSATTHAVAIATGGPMQPLAFCSGTLVSSNVVLTARHCVANLTANATSCADTFSESASAPEDLWIDATPWAAPSPSWKKVSSLVLPEQTAVCGNDIALLVLDSPYLASEATPARPVISGTEFRTTLAARVFGIAGFGATSARGEGEGVRRSRFDIAVECAPGDPAFECAGYLDFIDRSEFIGGVGPCSGDSGGGALSLSDHDVVFGVLSRGEFVDGACAKGVFERTDVWGWLIAKTVLDATPPDRTAPAWARAAFPEPPRAFDRCRGPGTCGSDAECVSFDARRSFVCAARCGPGCAAGTHCESEVCARDAPDASSDTPSSGGCSSAPERGSDMLGALALVLAVGVLRGRRDRCRAASAIAPRPPGQPTATAKR